MWVGYRVIEESLRQLVIKVVIVGAITLVETLFHNSYDEFYDMITYVEGVSVDMIK